MTTQLFTPLLPAAAKFLASNGMNVLAGIFGKSKVGEKIKEIAGKIKNSTGIELSDLANGSLSEEQLVKLKQFELEHERQLLDHLMEMQKLELEMDKTSQQDRADARGMQKSALSQDDLFSKRFIYGYATLVTLATFGYIFFVTFTEIPEGNTRIVDTVLGFLLGVSLSAIIQFFFGSSKSSGEKQSKIDELSTEIVRLSRERKRHHDG